MVRRSFRFLFATSLALTGCSALLDVKDIYFDPNAGGAGSDASDDGTASDGKIPVEGGADAATCEADLQKDGKNCGRCAHDCGGGTCTAGVCQALELTSLTDTPLDDIVQSGASLFVSTRVTTTSQTGGIWRVPKAGGAVEAYVTTHYAERMAVLGDKLYFVVDESIANGGGLFSCPLVGASPCTPALVAAAEQPRSITVDNGRLFYGDNASGKGLMLYAPPAAPVVFLPGFGFTITAFVSGNRMFYSYTFQPPSPPQHAKILEAFADGGVDEIDTYDSDTANDGELIGDANQFFFTAYDYSGTTGGIVRRIPRTGSSSVCNYGGMGNKRPGGIHTDGPRLYWTNQGEGAAQPYTKGSIATCETAGCCATPVTMWTGDGQPTAITSDADFVYFVTYVKGGVWKVAKP
ncbi:MAG: hypothetical protein JWP87_6340 [Labilithrix sp.]|nr:hypothetical protein [Labilithrix sp.]